MTDVRFWHKADMLVVSANCPLSEVKRTSRKSREIAIRRSAAIVRTSAPVRIGAVATSGYHFHEGRPFAMCRRS